MSQRAGRAVLVLAPLLLLLAVTTGIFEAARTHYLPSTGPHWCILDPSGVADSRFCANALRDPPSVAEQAATALPALIVESAARSSILVALATGLALALGVPLGFWLAIHAPRRVADAMRPALLVGITVPAFFLTFLLQVVAVEAAEAAGGSIIPVFGYGLDGHLVIPVLALAVAPFVYATRLVGIGATGLNAQDYVRAARAKGLSELRVTYGHIAPNMLGALGEAGLGAMRLVLAALVIVEYLVGWPGLGGLLLRAVRLQDLAALLAAATVLGIVFLLLEWLVDLVTRRTGVVSG